MAIPRVCLGFLAVAILVLSVAAAPDGSTTTVAATAGSNGKTTTALGGNTHGSKASAGAGTNKIDWGSLLQNVVNGIANPNKTSTAAPGSNGVDIGSAVNNVLNSLFPSNQTSGGGGDSIGLGSLVKGLLQGQGSNGMNQLLSSVLGGTANSKNPLAGLLQSALAGGSNGQGNVGDMIGNLLKGFSSRGNSSQLLKALSQAMNPAASGQKGQPNTGNMIGNLLKGLGGMGNSSQPLNALLQMISPAAAGGSFQQRMLGLLAKAATSGMPSFEEIQRALFGAGSLATLTAQALHSRYPHISTTCFADIGMLVQGMTKGAPWALQMLDASGKIPRSILKGNVKMIGNYDECREIDQPVGPNDGAPARRIKGGYYNFLIMAPRSSLPEVMAPLAQSGNAYIPWHLCLPRSCPKNEIQRDVANKGDILGTGLRLVYIDYKEPVYLQSDDKAAIATLCLLGLFILLVLLGTALDVFLLFAKSPGKELKDEKPSPVQHVNNAYVPGGEENVMVGNVEELKTSNTSADQKGINGGNEAIPKAELNDGDANHAGKENGIMAKVDTVAMDTPPHTRTRRRTNPVVSVLKGLLLSFSLRINTSKLFKVQHASGALTCLHGIRVLSMAWVVLGHTLVFDGVNKENPGDVWKLLQNFFMQIMLNTYYSVDSFFLMSGFLVAFLFLKESKKQGNKVTCKQMAYYYFHRYWRLTPAMMGSVIVYGYLYKYLGDGPMWQYGEDHGTCEKYWWTSLLYINNVVHDRTMCWGAGWYLSNDMQFYVISPIVLVPMAFGFFKIGYLLCLALLAVSLGTTGWIIHRDNSTFIVNGGEWFQEYYIKPYCRVGVYAVGLAFGAFLHQKGTKMKISKMTVFLGWLFAMGLMLMSCLMTYDVMKEGAKPWTPEGNAAWQAMCRPIWGLVLSWIILACVTGNGGFINSILSWPGWLPFSRLSYGVYLLHLTLIKWVMDSQRVLGYYTFIDMIYRFLGYTAASFACSYVLNVLVESPFIGLENVILGKKRKH